jgi:phosphate transport system substrate-binding protein
MLRSSAATAILPALLAGGVVMLAGAACKRSAAAGLTLAGSTSVQPFAEKWADAYRARWPGPPIQVQGGGSTAGVQAVLSGAAEVGMASRALTRVEAARAIPTVVARDGMAVIVNPTNPIGGLALMDVRAVYAGDRRNWRLFGGPDSAINVVTREEGSGTRAAFEELVMGGRHIKASAVVQDSTGSVRQMVAADPGAIGYVSMGLVDASVKPLALDGVAPSEAAIDERRYPLVRPFLFVTRGSPGPDARAFIEWIVGPEGRELTRREGLLPPPS